VQHDHTSWPLHGKNAAIACAITDDFERGRTNRELGIRHP